MNGHMNDDDDVLLKTLKNIEEICLKAVAVNDDVDLLIAPLEYNEKNLIIELQLAQNRLEGLIVESESLSPYIAAVGESLVLILKCLPFGPFCRFIEIVSSAVEGIIQIVAINNEHESKLALVADEKRKLEEAALILADRMKFERHSSESRYSELLSEFHDQAETIENLKLRLERAMKNASPVSKSTDTDMLEEMLRKISRLDIELAESRKECDQSSRARIVSEEQLRQLTIRYDEKEEIIRAQCKQIEELRATCDSLQQVCISWQEYSQKNALQQDAASQLELLEVRLLKADQATRDSEAQAEALQKSLLIHSAENNSLRKKEMELTSKLRQISCEMTGLKESHNHQSDELRKEIFSLKHDTEVLADRVTNLVESLSAAQEECASTSLKLDQAERSIHSLRTELASANSRLDSNADKDRIALASMSQTIRALEAEKAYLRGDLLASQVLASSLSNDVRAASEELAKYRSKQVSTDEERDSLVAKLQADKSSLEDEKNSLLEKLSKTQFSFSKLSNNLKSAIDTAAEEKAKAAAIEESASSRIRSLEAEKAALDFDLKACQNNIEVMSQDLRNKSMLLEALNRSASTTKLSLEAEINLLREELVSVAGTKGNESPGETSTKYSEEILAALGSSSTVSGASNIEFRDICAAVSDLVAQKSSLEYEITLSERQSELSALKLSVEKLDEVVSNLSHDKKALEDSLIISRLAVDSLRIELSEARSVNTTQCSVDHVETIRDEKAQLEEQLSACSEALKAMTIKCDAAEDSVANMIEELVQIRGETASSLSCMREELELIKAENGVLNKTIQGKELEYNEGRSKTVSVIKQADELQDRIKVLENERKYEAEKLLISSNDLESTITRQSDILMKMRLDLDAQEKVIDHLKLEKEAAEAKISELVAKRQEKESSEAAVVMDLYSNLTESRREKNLVDDRLRECQLKLDGMNNELEESRALGNEVILLRSAFESLQAEKTALEQELKAVHKVHHDAKCQEIAELASLQELVQQLQSDKETLERELQTLSSREQAALEHESDEVLELRFTVGDLLRDKSSLEEKIRASQSEIASLIEQVELYQPFESECMFLQTTIDALKTEKLHVEEVLKSKDGMVDATQLEGLAREKERLFEQLAASETVKKSVLEQVELLKSSLETSVKDKVSLEDQLCGAQSLIRSLVQQVDERTLSVSDVKELDELKIEVTQASNQIQQLEKELEEAQTELEEAQGEELRLHSVVKEAKEIEQALKETNAALQGHVREIAQQLEKEVQLRGEAENQVEQYRAQILELKQSLEHLQSERKDMESRLQSQDSELRKIQKEPIKRQELNNDLAPSESPAMKGVPALGPGLGPTTPMEAVVSKQTERIVTPLKLLEKTFGTAMSAYFHSSNQAALPDVASTTSNPKNAVIEDANLSETQLYVEIGAFEIRIGVWSRVTLSLDTCYICPAIVATLKPVESVDALIFNGEVDSERALNLFRQEAILVGREAFYCAYNHSDWRLREALEISYPLVQGRVRNSHGFLFLIRHALECAAEATGMLDLRSTRVVLSHKPTWVDQDLYLLADALFAQSHCGPVNFLSECALVLEASGARSALVVDIGASSAYAVAVHKGNVINESLKPTAVGGEHVTEFLCALVEAQSGDEENAFARQLPRRRVQIARQLKEDYGFVATDFQESTQLYGRKSLEQCRRLLCSLKDRETVINYKSSRPNEIKCGEEFALPDGSSVSVTLDCERFFCAEVLFVPSVLSSCHSCPGLVKLILDAAAAVDTKLRQEVCSRVLLTGRSSLLPGISARLDRDLAVPLRKLGVTDMSVQAAESVDWPPSAAWGGVTSWLRSQDSLLKEAGSNRIKHESLVQSRLVSARDYNDRGPSVLSRARLNSTTK